MYHIFFFFSSNFYDISSGMFSYSGIIKLNADSTVSDASYISSMLLASDIGANAFFPASIKALAILSPCNILGSLTLLKV